MKLAETTYDNAETGCCARLDPEDWDGKVLTWKDKPFLRDQVRAAFHVPLNFGTVMTRVQAAVEAAEAYPVQPFTLSDEASLWRSDLYVSVDREVPGARMGTLSGTFLTKAFQGPYRDMGRWAKEIRSLATARGHTVRKLFYFYATCPKCARAFGGNQVVLFAQVD